MNRELEEKLAKNYPNLYRDYRGDIRKTCMYWGFEHRDGWFDIIDRLSAKLEPLGVVAVQVKEKFGELRFYIKHGSDEVYDLIEKAEGESQVTCEVCGEMGKLRSEGWLKTLCDDCQMKRNK